MANLGLNGLMKMLKGPQEIETGYFGQIVVVVEAAQRIAGVAVFGQGTVVAVEQLVVVAVVEQVAVVSVQIAAVAEQIAVVQ